MCTPGGWKQGVQFGTWQPDLCTYQTFPLSHRAMAGCTGCSGRWCLRQWGPAYTNVPLFSGCLVQDWSPAISAHLASFLSHLWRAIPHSPYIGYCGLSNMATCREGQKTLMERRTGDILREKGHKLCSFAELNPFRPGFLYKSACEGPTLGHACLFRLRTEMQHPVGIRNAPTTFKYIYTSAT